MSKPKVIKDYNKLHPYIVDRIKLFYPFGFEKKLILFKNHKNKLVSALPFEGDYYFYMVRMTKEQAQEIIQADEDFDHNGNLKAESIPKLESSEKPPAELIVVKAPAKAKAESTTTTKSKATKTKAKATKPKAKTTKTKAKTAKPTKPKAKATKPKAKATKTKAKVK